MSTLKIAVCQHSLSGNISKNLAISIKQIKIAAAKRADVILFPECNLSGYAGVEFTEYLESRWIEQNEALDKIARIAAKLRVWIIVGGYWFSNNSELPLNSLFVIDAEGNMKCRYDKRLLTSGDSGDDVDYFSPGSDPVIFSINGIRCGSLICHEWRYPELYREYKSMGVDLIFQSWYDANVDPEVYQKEGRDHGSLIMGAVRSNAANNYLWICGSNACNRESSMGSFLVQPDGIVKKKLARNKTGILLTEVDTSGKFIDPSKHNREKFL